MPDGLPRPTVRPSFLDQPSPPAILDPEEWFDGLRPFRHRGLCPYDLARLLLEHASVVLRRLARAHSHLVLSHDSSPAVRSVHLLFLPRVESPPEENFRWLAHFVDYGLIAQSRNEAPVDLAPRGRDFARVLLGLPRYLRGITYGSEAG